MNRKEANEIRVSIGLQPLDATAHKTKSNQAKNQAKRAQECRDLKYTRTGQRVKGNK